MASLAVRGLNLGIDFKGGVVWEVPQNGVSVSDAEAAASDLGVKGVTVQTLTAEGSRACGSRASRSPWRTPTR